MIEPQGGLHFSIAVSDLAVSRKFYTKILGLAFVHDASDQAMIFLRASADYVVLARSDAPLARDL